MVIGKLPTPGTGNQRSATSKAYDGKSWFTGKLWMGPGTHEVPLELFAQNRRRLIGRLLPVSPRNAIVVLEGGQEVPFYDTDTTYNEFRQESYFLWAFGAYEPGCYGAIEVTTGAVHLFVPRYPKSYAIWMGPIHPLENFAQKYGIPNVHYSDEIASVLQRLNPSVLLTLKGVNSDSGLTHKEAEFEGIEKFQVDNSLLFDPIADLRVFKTDYEIAVMKYVIEISSAAHRKVMRFAKAGRSEYQCESEFLHHCYVEGGCRHVSYTCICASHANAAILHYGHAAAPNDRFLNQGEMCLFDMGANYFGYAADITCSFPVSGIFTPDQTLIYEAVLAANLAVFDAAKPGVPWRSMHLLANRTLLAELKKGGLVVGDVDEMVAAGLGSTFQPHGLGHLLGLDVHDVGGYISTVAERPTTPKGVERLRTNRILEDRMILTIEPGCYFIDIQLDEALADPALSKFLVPDVVNRFRGTGGVRIEDDVLITAQGAVNLTKVPRTVQEVEDWIAGKDDGKYD